MSREKFDICWTFYNEMSSENSKCPARDWRFAEQNVRWGSNEFRTLWLAYWKQPDGLSPMGSQLLLDNGWLS